MVLAFYSADDWVNILKEIGTVIASISALLLAWSAYKKSNRAQETSNQAQTTSAVADAKSNIANDRISNVAKFQDTMRSDMQTNASNSIPKDVASLLLNSPPPPSATMGSPGKPMEVHEVGVVKVQEVGKKQASGT